MKKKRPRHIELEIQCSGLGQAQKFGGAKPKFNGFPMLPLLSYISVPASPFNKYCQ